MNEREIFIEALQKTTPAERAAYLAQACGGNDELRRCVEELLQAESGLGNFLEPPEVAVEIAQPGTTYIPAQGDGPGSQIGPYKLLQQIGEGGMGFVYMAEQIKPVNRRVAFKIIKPGVDTRQVIARFEAERQALALMDHQCIAKVFDAGATESGRPYFVMELVKGIPITTFCDQQQLSVNERLTLFLQVCQAVQHAHQKGVIHRDLKPSNVLVALYDGIPVPKVIDFGLAKATNQRLTEKTLFTEFGQVVGTLEYMSPEQAELNQLDIDTRTDIYSLGAMLYELLTGSTPLERARIRSAAFNEILRIIREEEPQKPSTRLSTLQQADLSAVSQQRGIDPRKLSSLFRGELDWVVMKALDKNRTRRYETANGLARDIQHYLADEAVEARPPSSMYRLRKFASRHKVGAAVSVAAVCVLFATAAGLAVSNRMITAEKNEKEQALVEREEALRASRFHEEKATQNAVDADRQRIIARQERDSALKQLYVANMSIAHQEWNDKHVARVRELLASYSPDKSHGIDLRGWEWHYLWRLSHSERRVLNLKTVPVSLAFTPDGQSLVIGGDDGVLRIWNAEGTRERRSIKAHDSRIKKLAISLDGKTLVTAGTDGTAKIWDLATMKERRSFSAPKGSSRPVALNSEGTLVAIGTQEIAIYDVIKGSEIRRLKGHREQVGQLDFSPDGRQIVSCAGNDGVRLWNAATGEEIRRFAEGGWAECTVAMSHDGRTLASGDISGAVTLWDADTGQRHRWLKAQDNPISGIAFSRDGNRVATASGDTTVQIWDPSTGYLIHTFYGHTEGVTDVAFAPNTDVIASSAWDGSVRFWDSASRQQTFARSDPWDINCVLYSPEGLYFAVANSWDLVVCDASSANALWTAHEPLRAGGGPGCSPLAFAGNARIMASGRTDGVVTLRDARTGQTIRNVHAHGKPVTRIQFFPDGRMATASLDGEIAFWSTGDAHEIARYRAHRDAVHSLALSPDGKLLASGSGENDPAIRIWVTDTGRLSKTLAGHEGTVHDLVFSQDGNRLFSGSRDGTLRCWDTTSGHLFRTQRAHAGSTLGLALSPDGNRLASCSDDATVKIWDAQSGSELFTLKPQKGSLFTVAFSPDGLRLSTGGLAGGFAIWDARPLTAELRVEQAAGWLVSSLFDQLWVKNDVVASIKSMAAIDESVRQRAAALAERYFVSNWNNNQRSRSIVRRADLTPDKYTRALRAAEAGCEADPNNRGCFNTLGVAQYRLGNWKAAETTFRKSMGLSGGGDANDWFFLAMIAWRQGEQDHARKWYKAADLWKAKYAPKNDDLNGFRAEAAALLGMKDQAPSEKIDERVIAQALIDADPSTISVQSWQIRAAIHMRAGRWSEAKADALRIATLQPSNAFYQYQLASLLARAGDVEAYYRHSQRLLAQYAETDKPEWAERAAKASLILPVTGEALSAASRLAGRAVTLDPKHWALPWAHVAAGLAAYRRGEFRESVGWCDKALSKDLSDGWFRSGQAYDIRAMAMARLGQSAEAKMAFDNAHAILQKMQAAANANGVDNWWHDLATCELLHAEAEKLLKTRPK